MQSTFVNYKIRKEKIGIIDGQAEQLGGRSRTCVGAVGEGAVRKPLGFHKNFCICVC